MAWSGGDADAFHFSDLFLEFETLAKCWRPFKGKHYDLTRPVYKYWTNYTKNSDPNGFETDGTPMPEWTLYTLKSPVVME